MKKKQTRNWNRSFTGNDLQVHVGSFHGESYMKRLQILTCNIAGIKLAHLQMEY